MKTFTRMLILVRPYRRHLFLAMVLLLALTAVDMVFPSLIGQVIDNGLKAGEQNVLIFTVAILLGLGLLKAFASLGQRYMTEWIANHVAFDLRNRLYDHIQHMPFTYHDHIQSGQLISRVIEDVRAIQIFTGSGILELIRISLLLITILVLLFSTNPVLALITLAPMIPLIWVTTNYGKRIGQLFLVVDNMLGDLSSKLQENVNGVQVVRAFAREKHEIENFDQTNRGLFYAQINVLREWSKIMPTTTLLVTIGTILILWFGGQMVLKGTLSLGQLVEFNSYMLLLALPAQNLGWLVNTAGEASAGLERTFEILDHAPEITSPQDAIDLKPLTGKIEFDQVSFNYTGEPNQALKDINLVVEPGQVIALIGPTGSGKTSLVNLISRFYDVSSGVVRVDGCDVQQIDLATLRSQIGIVLQTSLLFTTTIKENLAYGRPQASMEQIVAAAKAAQAHDFILGLPQGYDTIVGERGVTISGGQRQRVAIARALLLDPPILILDDSTSSVDSQTEHQIQKALSNLMEGRTTFVIAQRLSTVKRADLILVLDRGQIVERGCHEELLRQGGLYQQIYELQLKDQERFQEDLEQIQAAQFQLDSETPGSLEFENGSEAG